MNSFFTIKPGAMSSGKVCIHLSVKPNIVTTPHSQVLTTLLFGIGYEILYPINLTPSILLHHFISSIIIDCRKPFFNCFTLQVTALPLGACGMTLFAVSCFPEHELGRFSGLEHTYVRFKWVARSGHLEKPWTSRVQSGRPFADS